MIANRGEIANRIISTLHDHEIQSTIFSSQVDLKTIPVKRAGRVIELEGNSPGETYLNIPLLVEKALEAGIDAVHPGYGFLSENVEFRRQLEKHKIPFIGPTTSNMQKLGDKASARKAAIKSDTPLLPGTSSTLDISSLKDQADEIGYPILIKASAGGGGRGIRLVNSPKDFETQAANAQKEAEIAFGDGHLFVEKYLDHAKHIEVQVIGLGDGDVLHFGERDCSIQRKNQKLIEEAPAASLTRDEASAIHDSAVNLTSSVKYLNAGTVEFLVDKDKNHYFLEVNTRIQVEHPVSEFITGEDLIWRQIQVAAGEPLEISQNDIHFRGHAIEARINVENPFNNFQPSVGKITSVTHPSGPGIRVDSFIENGSEISNYYDSLVSKLIVFSTDRKAAINRLHHALSMYRIRGVHSTIPFIQQILRNTDFVSDVHHVKYLEQHLDAFKIPSDVLQAGKAVLGYKHFLEQGLKHIETADVAQNAWSKSLFPKVRW